MGADKNPRRVADNEAMAIEKLSEGIRLFCIDTEKFATLIEQARG